MRAARGDDTDRQAERFRVDVDAVTADHPAFLQSRQPLAHGRRGHADAPRERRNRLTRIIPQQPQQREVRLIEQVIRGLKAQVTILL